VYAVRTQDDDSLGESYRDVFIEVEETTTGSISAFAGFSTADNIFGGIELSETNFNYRGLGQLFTKGLPALRGGGEYLQLKANIGAKQTSYVLSWLTPYFRDTLWRVGFDISRTTSHVVDNSVQTSTTGGSLFASYPVTNLWTFGWRYRVRNSTNKKRKSETMSEQEKEAIHQHGVISATSVSMNFDSTDRISKPHNGFRSYMEAEYAGIGGKFYFGKLSYLNSYYTQMWPHGIMKYRFDFRFIQPLFSTSKSSEIPLSERFYLGGEGSVRGYVPYGLGPQYAETNDPKGGISSSVLSIEYLHEILRILDGFLFIDAGSLSLNQYRVGVFRMSWGFGIRLELMNRVPVTLGMGFPINPARRDEVQKFYFSMGGQF
jgi:outer membrane protein insertion porin family